MKKKYHGFFLVNLISSFLNFWTNCVYAAPDIKTSSLEMSYCSFDYSFFYNKSKYHIETIASVITNGNWRHPVLFDPRAYDWLYLAYNKGLINEADFLEAQDYLQCISAFGLMSGIPSSVFIRKAAKIERWNIFDDNELLEKYMETLNKHIGSDKFEEFILTYTGSDDLKITAVSLNSVFLNKLHSDYGHPADGATQEDQFSKWMHFLHKISPVLVYIDVDNGLLMFPGYKLFNALREYLPDYIASERRVELKGHYCTMDMDDVVLLKSAAKHPFAMYHPKHMRNLIKPHEAFLSAMGSRHDFYHIIKLDGIPFEYQQYLLVEELIAEDFYRYSKFAAELKLSLTEVFPEEVRRKIAETEMDYFRNDPQKYYNHHRENSATIGITVYEDILSSRSLADQDFITEINPEYIVYKAIFNNGWGINNERYYQNGFMLHLFFRTNFAAYRWNQIYGRNSYLMRLFNHIKERYEDYPESYHLREIKAIFKAWE